MILRNAPILVLDEATSALDSEIEAAIQSSLDTLMAGKTVIAIAHRLSTIARMDRLVVLDRGRIVEQGTHEALLRHDGHYAALWRRQSGGFLDAGDMQAAEVKLGLWTFPGRGAARSSCGVLQLLIRGRPKTRNTRRSRVCSASPSGAALRPGQTRFSSAASPWRSCGPRLRSRVRS